MDAFQNLIWGELDWSWDILSGIWPVNHWDKGERCMPLHVSKN